MKFALCLHGLSHGKNDKRPKDQFYSILDINI